MVSGTMNMAGNMGSFVTSLAFPYLLGWTGSPLPYFYLASVLSVVAIVMWASIDPTMPIASDQQRNLLFEMDESDESEESA